MSLVRSCSRGRLVSVISPNEEFLTVAEVAEAAQAEPADREKLDRPRRASGDQGGSEARPHPTLGARSVPQQGRTGPSREPGAPSAQAFWEGELPSGFSRGPRRPGLGLFTALPRWLSLNRLDGRHTAAACASPAGTASPYTATRLPSELELALPLPSRTAARREEARIKRLPRAAKLALLR